MSIDISNIINVNIAKLPSTLTSDNVNVIAIFTNETPIYPINNYKIYKNANACLNDFGIDSDTYKMVASIYNQSLNIQAGNGYVVVIPKLANVSIEATATTVKCENLISELFKNVSDGSFKITLNGTETVISDLDFTNTNNLEEVAEVIKNKFASESIDCDLIVEDNTLTFVNGTTGSTGTLVISSDTTGTDLTTLNYLNIDKAITTQGQDAFTGAERVQDCYNRTKGLIFYEAILNTDEIEQNDIEKLASMIENENKIALFVLDNYNDALSIGTSIKNKSYTKTRILYYNGNDKLLFLSGYTSKALSINYNGFNTVYNLHTKEIVGIEADDTINDDQLQALKQAGIDCYVNIKGLGSIFTSKNNDFIDNVIFKNWFKMSLEIAGFNCLRTNNSLPQTENGMSTYKNAYIKVIKQAIRVGFVSAGTWNLPIYLGTDRKLFEDNISQVGYYVYSMPVAEQNKEEREERKATSTSLALKMSGAINSGDLLVYINN